MRGLRDFLVGHFGTFLVALVLAGLTWFYFFRSGSSTREYTAVQIAAKSVDSDMLVLAGPEPKALASLRLAGPEIVLKELPSAGELVAIFEYAGDTTGVSTEVDSRRNLAIGKLVTRGDAREVERLDLPTSVRITEMLPPSFIITFDRVAEKQLRAVVQVRGEPAKGYVISSTEAVPTHVAVLGPASVIARATEIETAPVNVSGFRASWEGTVGLIQKMNHVVGGKTVEVAVRSDESVRARVVVTEETVSVSTTADVVSLLPANFAWEATVDALVPIKLKVPRALVDNEGKLRAPVRGYVDLTDIIIPGVYPRRLILLEPRQAQVEGEVPELMVSVSPRKRPETAP